MTKCQQELEELWATVNLITEAFKANDMQAMAHLVRTLPRRGNIGS